MKRTFKRIISTAAAITLMATLSVPVMPVGEQAEVKAAVTAGENLLSNPGAENATTGWTMLSSGAKQWIAISYPNKEGYPAPHGGTHYFVPGASSADELYQDIDITGATGVLTFSGWMRDYTVDHGDESSLRLEIWNNNGKLLAMTSSETVTKTDQWTQKTTSLTIPTGASFARVLLVSKRNPASAANAVSDSYFDDLSLVYTQNNDPADKYTPKKGGFIIKDDITGSIVEIVNGGEDSNTPVGRYRGPIDNSMKKIVIPGEIIFNNQKVLITAVSAGAFKNNKVITSVKIAATDKTGTDADPAAKAAATSTNAPAANTASPADGSAATSSALDVATTPLPAPQRSLTIESKAFSGCTNLKKVTLNSDLTLISKNAFYKCTRLAKVTIPSKVAKIGKKAFFGCSSLNTITIKTKKLTAAKVGASAFKGIGKKAVIYVPKKKFAAYKKLLASKGVTLKTQKIKKK